MLKVPASEKASYMKKKIIILIVSITALALAVSCFGVFWFVRHQSQTRQARKQCELRVAQMEKKAKIWETIITSDSLNNILKVKSNETTALQRLINKKTPDLITCTANSPEELRTQGAYALSATQWYEENTEAVRKQAVSLLADIEAKEAKEKAQKDTLKADEAAKKATNNLIAITPRAAQPHKVTHNAEKKAPANQAKKEKPKKPQQNQKEENKKNKQQDQGNNPKPEKKKNNSENTNSSDNKGNTSNKTDSTTNESTSGTNNTQDSNQNSGHGSTGNKQNEATSSTATNTTAGDSGTQNQ